MALVDHMRVGLAGLSAGIRALAASHFFSHSQSITSMGGFPSISRRPRSAIPNNCRPPRARSTWMSRRTRSIGPLS